MVVCEYIHSLWYKGTDNCSYNFTSTWTPRVTANHLWQEWHLGHGHHSHTWNVNKNEYQWLIYIYDNNEGSYDFLILSNKLPLYFLQSLLGFIMTEKFIRAFQSCKINLASLITFNESLLKLLLWNKDQVLWWLCTYIFSLQLYLPMNIRECVSYKTCIYYSN